MLLTLSPQPTMDFDGTPAICSTAAYEPYLQLSAFPPAQAYCSNLSSESPIQVGDPTCASGSDRCILLSYLQAADPTFAQTVWYASPSEPTK